MVKLGILGISDGNGHPYSWSAIINGFNRERIGDCGFPVIYEYLSRQTWPQDRIKSALVTHVWTQDHKTSRKIAASCLIDHIVNSPADMIGEIDAVLLARDDSDNHLQHARPFLEAGLPIYIDKPIATTVSSLEALYQLQTHDAQIFTCSALRYSRDLRYTTHLNDKVGRLIRIDGIAPKTWHNYAVHIIEPVLRILGKGELSVLCRTGVGRGGVKLACQDNSGVAVNFSVLGAETTCPFEITLYGTKGSHKLVWTDTFYSFKSALEDFLLSVRTSSQRSPYAFNRDVVRLIEAGNYDN